MVIEIYIHRGFLIPWQLCRIIGPLLRDYPWQVLKHSQGGDFLSPKCCTWEKLMRSTENLQKYPLKQISCQWNSSGPMAQHYCYGDPICLVDEILWTFSCAPAICPILWFCMTNVFPSNQSHDGQTTSPDYETSVDLWSNTITMVWPSPHIPRLFYSSLNPFKDRINCDSVGP